MASWSTKRKTTYISILTIIIAVMVLVPFFLFYYKPPTCFDNLKNGKETGIDCGGKCARICSDDYLNPKVPWSRFERVAPGVHNLGAYVVNPNLDVASSNVEYLFKLYDKMGILIAERRGFAYLPAHKNVLFFEPSVVTGERVPATITFEFLKAVTWKKVADDDDDFIVNRKEIFDEKTKPRLIAEIANRSARAYDNIDVVAILYDEDENTVGFSKTKIDSLPGGRSAEVVFTWQLPRTNEVARIEIIPTVRP